jgi:hypothetical protein
MTASSWILLQSTRLRFWLAHHVAVPLLRKALACPSRRADSLEDRLRHEVTTGRVTRIAEQMRWESDQGLRVCVDDTVRRLVESVEASEIF